MSRNHGVNPALLGVGSRSVLEVATSQEVGVSNSHFGSGDVFRPEFEIDLATIKQFMGSRGIQIAGSLSAGVHGALSLFDVTAGAYTGVDGVVSAGLPGSLFTVLSEGNIIDETYSDSRPIVARVFAEAGAVAGLRLQSWQFGLGAALYAPVLYTGSDAGVGYLFTTDTEAGTASLTGSFSAPSYSSFDVTGSSLGSGGNLLARLDGIKLDVGVVHLSEEEPHFGVNVGGIPIRPATATREIDLAADASLTIENPLGRSDGGDISDAFATEFSDFEPSVTDDAAHPVSYPLHFGGFYRLTAIPPIALTGHSQFYLADPFLMELGVFLEGRSFPLNLFSLGLGYDRVAWEATFGMGFDVRIVEMGFALGVASPQFGGLFRGAGLHGELYAALGF
ncbi:MAG: hypothetical protein ACLFO1_04710 [Spirochaetaceae bacterium]